jgi:hypothetical protein
MERRDLHVGVIPSSAGRFVLDPHVGKVDLLIEVRQVVNSCPFLDLGGSAIGPTIAPAHFRP